MPPKLSGLQSKQCTEPASQTTLMDSTTRTALFLLVCLGSRLALVFLVGALSPNALKMLAVLAALVSLGFLVIFSMGLRKSGLETGGEPIWWNGLRPFHAATYGMVALLAWSGHVRCAQAV